MKYKCHFCGGDVEENVLMDVEEEGIVIKSIPADVCRQCGEVYYSPTVAQMINEVVNLVKQKKQLFLSAKVAEG